MPTFKNTIIKRKNDLDKFHTPLQTAQFCVAKILETAALRQNTLFFEPSAGEGSFIKALLSFGQFNNKGVDIEPEADFIEKRDFLKESFEFEEETIIFGNPPFGKNANLAVRFFNRAASFKNVSYIAFILPRTFNKISILSRLDESFHLVKSYTLNNNLFYLNGKTYKVPSCFQIWKKESFKRPEIDVENKFLKFVKKEDAQFAIRRVGARAGQVLEGVEYNSSTTYFCREVVSGVKDIISKIDFTNEVESTSGVRSISKKEIILKLSNIISC